MRDEVRGGHPHHTGCNAARAVRPVPEAAPPGAANSSGRRLGCGCSSEEARLRPARSTNGPPKAGVVSVTRE